MRSRGRVMLEGVKYMYGGLIQFEVLYEGFGSYTKHFFSLLSLNVSSFIWFPLILLEICFGQIYYCKNLEEK